MTENVNLGWSQWIVMLGFASLVLELACFHVPSVASNVNIIRKQPAVVQGYSARFRGLFQYSLLARITLSMLPLLPVYAVFLYPLLVIFGFMNAAYPVPEIFVWLGCGFILAGRLTTFASVLIIRQQNQQKADSFYLHTDFLFGRSRNPGLLGMYIFILGVWFLMPSIQYLVGIFYYFAYMHFKVLMEEDFLEQKFGEPYLQYKTTTGRYWS